MSEEGQIRLIGCLGLIATAPLLIMAINYHDTAACAFLFVDGILVGIVTQLLWDIRMKKERGKP